MTAPKDRSSPEYKAWRREYDRQRWLSDPKYRAKNATYYSANRAALSESKSRYWSENRGRMAAAHKRWVENNRHVVRANNAARKKLVARATPAWADMDAIKAVYAEAERLSKETGIPHHVDHFYPLQGETVCGLHVAENLQPLPAADNIRKKNRVPDVVSA